MPAVLPKHSKEIYRMMSGPERRALRARSHSLKPVVLLGQNQVTSAVMSAIDEALTAHELIKVRLRGVERDERTTTAANIASELGAEIINLIGQVLTVYRAKPAAPPATRARVAPPKRPVRKSSSKKNTTRTSSRRKSR